MRPLETREKVLIGVLAVVALAVWFGLGGEGLGFGTTDTQESTWGDPLGEPPQVKMGLLARNAEGYDPGGRNLFSYYVPPPPKRAAPPPPPPREPPRRTPVTPPPRRDPIQRPVTQGPPKPNFDYIGFIGPKDDRIAVFSDRDEVFVARVGETVQEQFKLQEFGYETVVLGYVSGSYQGQTAELKKKSR